MGLNPGLINQLSGSTLTQETTGLVPEVFDSIYNVSDTLTDTLTYKLLGTTVATVTVTYTDETKTTLVSAIRT